jgi:hypothetical protein
MKKETMMKKLILLVSITAALSFTTNAISGSKISKTVNINSQYFSGSFGSVRNSSNTGEYLRCADFGSSATCIARNTANVNKVCSTSNQEHLDVIRGMDDSSYVRVFYNSSGQCTGVSSYTASYFEPKVK